MENAPRKSYQIISRRYRPDTFESIIGQEAIVTPLKNALRSSMLAHAYLFCGSRGVGKTTFARLFAKALNCKELTKDLEPCNSCSSCKEISAGRSLDVLEIDGASNRGIDDIRQINETVGYATTGSKYKIYIIDEVHMLTKEAFNALLKTLEEPPSNVKFFFATTEPHKIPQTIISRCQRFDLQRITPEMISRKLTAIAQDLNIQIEKEALRLISHLAEGSLRDAESLFDQVICYAEGPIDADMVTSILGLTPRSLLFQLDRAIYEGQKSHAFELAGQLFASGKDIGHFMEGLMEHFRLILLLKTHPTALPSSLSEHDQQQYQTSAALYSEEQALHILDFLMQWIQQLAKFPFKRIGIEMILLHLLRSRHHLSIETLVQRLTDLEKKLGSPQSSDFNPPLPVKEVEKPLPKQESKEGAPQTADFTPPLGLKEIEKPLPKQESKEKTPSTPLAQTDNVKTPKVEEKLLQALKNKIASADLTGLQTPSPLPQESKIEQEIRSEIKEINPPSAQKSPSHYDTLLRFAAVELEGAVHKKR